MDQVIIQRPSGDKGKTPEASNLGNTAENCPSQMGICGPRMPEYTSYLLYCYTPQTREHEILYTPQIREHEVLSNILLYYHNILSV